MSVKGRKLSEEARRKIGEANRGRKRTEETRRRMSEAKRGKPKMSEGLKAGPTHKDSLVGVLKDPDGKTWPFRNLCHFVRTHPELFDPDDLVPYPRNRYQCRVMVGISSLFRRGRPAGSWKGWTLVSLEEKTPKSRKTNEDSQGIADQ